MSILRPALAITTVSAASMALEIVAGRALAPYVGMSLYTWTIVIAVVLAGLSLGHWVGGRIADRTARPDRAVAWALAGAGLTTLGSLRALREVAPMLEGVDPVPHIAALASAAFLAPSALAGLMAPLLTVIALRDAGAGHEGRVLGIMFALGAAGAILGTLAAGLLMISWLGSGGSVLLVAAAYGALSLLFWHGRARVAAGSAGAALALAGAVSPGAVGLASACRVESAYFCIRVDDVGGYGRAARVMALDHLAHGVNDREDPRLLLSPYVQGVDELVARRFAGPALRVFFIGGGAYTLPRAWAARYPEGRFTVAELDPAVTRVAREALWFDPDARTEVRHGDARQVLRSVPPGPRFDVVFGDAFHDISVPQHLVTTEFNAEVRARLAPGGVYVLNVVDALREPRLVLSMAATLSETFPAVELWLDIESIGPVEARTTWILLAAGTPTPADRLRAETGFGREWVRVPLDAMIATVGRDRILRLTDDYAPVDRLLAGVLLDADLAEGGR